MNANVTFQRLMWKEYRALRQLWAMCGLGGTLLMLVVLAIGESSEHSQGYSAIFWAFTVWVPPVYVLAALSTMFAGEREEGTLVWLTTLSPRLPSVLTSRLLFVLLTGIGLQIWYAVIALAFSQFDDHHGESYVDAEENLRILSFLLVESLAYGLLWSLQTNRPLNAILYAATTIVLVNSGAAMLVDVLGGRYSVKPDDFLDYTFSFWGWARCLIVLVVLALDWRLAEQWLHGHPWDWEWVAQWWSRRRVQAGTESTTATVATLPANAAEPWRRAWQRLRWLEWQGILAYAWIVLALALLSCGSILFRFDRQPPTLGFCLVFCWIAIIVAGLMSWHGEQSQQRFRTLVRLGVSPSALWVNKLLCWFAAAIVASVFIWGLTAALWSVLAWSAPGRPYHYLLTMWRQTRASPAAAEIITTIIGVYGLMFPVAFVASQLFRRTVIAFGAALIGCSLLMGWIVIGSTAGLPWQVFYAPIPLWLLWISWSSLPAWWTERTSWWVSRRRAATLALQGLFPVMLPALAAGYLVWEVPTITVTDPSVAGDPSTSINADLFSGAQNVRTEWNRLLILMQELPPLPPEVQAKGPVVDDVALHFHAAALTHLGLTPTEAREAFVRTNREQLKLITDQTLKLTTLAVENAPSKRSRYLGYVPMLVYAAQASLTAGEPDESLRYLQAAARLGGMVQRFTPTVVISPLVDPSIQDTRDEMIRWAQHPQQTEEILRRGLQLCAAELRYWQTQPEELYLHHLQERSLNRGAYWPWDRARAQKLADVMHINRATYLSTARLGSRRPGLSASLQHDYLRWMGYDDNDPRLRAWQYQPPQYRYFQDPRFTPVLGLDHNTVICLHQAENQYRATLAQMAVVGYRRIHGSLPPSLWDVEPWLGPYSFAMRDVWTGTNFGYVPTGFPLTAPQFTPDSAYRQPLLWSAESVHAHVDVREHALHRWTDDWVYSSHDLVRSGNGPQAMPWVFPIPPMEPAPPAKE